MDPITNKSFAKISLDQIRPHPRNPRPASAFKKSNPKMVELTNSIKNLGGLLQPVTLRKTGERAYEVVMGHRRYYACGYADMKTADAIIREMTDEEAIAALLAENMQREDADPILEARTIAIYLAEGKDLEAIAAKFGKTYSWAYKRAQVINLSEKWVEAFTDGKINWSIDHFALIARYSAEVQEQLYAEFIDGSSWDDFTLDSLTNALGRFHHDVSKTPWEADDAELVPKAGACSACPRRASCQQCLFDDLKIKKKGPDYCTDHACWETKAKAHLERRILDSKRRYGDDISLVSTVQYKPEDKSIIGYNDFCKVQKKEPGARRAVVVDGNHQGDIVWIKDVKSNRAAAPSAAKQAREEGREPSTKELTEDLTQKREALNKRRILHSWESLLTILEAMKPKEANKVPWKVKSNDPESEADYQDEETGQAPGNDEDPKAKVEDLPKGVVPETTPLMAWAIAHGLRCHFGVDRGGLDAQRVLVKNAKVLHDYLWLSCYATMREDLKRIISYRDMGTEIPMEVASLIGVDLDVLFAKSVEAVPEPKCWKVQYGDLVAA